MLVPPPPQTIYELNSKRRKEILLGQGIDEKGIIEQIAHLVPSLWSPFFPHPEAHML